MTAPTFEQLADEAAEYLRASGMGQYATVVDNLLATLKSVRDQAADARGPKRSLENTLANIAYDARRTLA